MDKNPHIPVHTQTQSSTQNPVPGTVQNSVHGPVPGISTCPRIIAIETSCDETAISYMCGLSALSHRVNSQAALHAEFGGVFPNLAKREHTENLTPLLRLVLRDVYPNFQPVEIEETEKNLAILELEKKESDHGNISESKSQTIKEILVREGNLGDNLISFINSISVEIFEEIKRTTDAIAVTYGPGLEPALWVGISFAKALAVIFDKPLYPINHMEGHIASVIADNSMNTDIATSVAAENTIKFPAIALLISGGHTELVQINSWHDYHILGQTVDDAVGEAYDKTARILGLPYPGGPEISKLADIFRANIQNTQSTDKQSNAVQSETQTEKMFTLPRPMLHTKDFNFSFSGLKTAVLYAVRDKVAEKNTADVETSDAINADKKTTLAEVEKSALAFEFESAVIDVLAHKTKKAIESVGAQSLLIGGGVISNTAIRAAFSELCESMDVGLFLPEKDLATDNATMIGLVAVLQYMDGKKGLMPQSENEKEYAEFLALKACGNLGFDL